MQLSIFLRSLSLELPFVRRCEAVIACKAQSRYTWPMKKTHHVYEHIQQEISIAYSFPVIFTRNLLASENPVLAEVLATAGPEPHRVLAFLDQGAVQTHPALPVALQEYAQAHAESMTLAAPPLLVPGGERAKGDLEVANMVLEAVYTHKLCRQSFILALGGGAVLDAVGFAAATAHRGVRLVRLPSTVLAQNDAGVGLKNGINLFGRKNFWGSFAPPFAVINDFALLDGLDPRDLRAGVAEAVKVACIRDRDFFQRLQAQRFELAGLESAPMESMVRDCAAAHLRHIATCGDPFELGSARPLDFGHWSAHALEEASQGAIRHGEAVAMGIALDSVYSQLSDMLPADELDMILGLLHDLQLPLTHPLLETMDMPAAVESFREHLGGCLHISLLEAIGRGVEVTSLDMERMRQAREELFKRARALEQTATAQ